MWRKPREPTITQCVSIAQCNKPIKSYLQSIKVYDTTLTSESQLLLARAGKFFSLIVVTLGELYASVLFRVCKCLSKQQCKKLRKGLVNIVPC